MKWLSGPSLAILDVSVWESGRYYLGQVCFQPIFIVVSSDFCTLMLCFFWGGGGGGPVIRQFSKNVFCVQKLFFFKFPCFKFNFWEPPFTLLKHYKTRVSAIFVFLLFKEKTRAKRNDNWNFWVLGSKNGCFVTVNCFCSFGLPKPLFYSVLGVRGFWAKWPKKGCLDKNKIGTDNFDWQLKSPFFFLLVFSFSFYLFFFAFCLFVFGFCFCLCYFGEGLRVRWGGPKDHLTWP